MAVVITPRYSKAVTVPGVAAGLLPTKASSTVAGMMAVPNTAAAAVKAGRSTARSRMADPNSGKQQPAIIALAHPAGFRVAAPAPVVRAMPSRATPTPVHQRRRSGVPPRTRSSSPATIGPVPMVMIVAVATPDRLTDRKNPSWKTRKARAPVTVTRHRRGYRQGAWPRAALSPTSTAPPSTTRHPAVVTAGWRVVLGGAVLVGLS